MAAPITDNTVVTPPIAEATTALADQLGNIENVVTLTMQQYTLGSLILMVSYGACFAFILFFLMSVQNLAPRYRLVPILSPGSACCRNSACGRIATRSSTVSTVRWPRTKPSPTPIATATGRSPCRSC